MSFIILLTLYECIQVLCCHHLVGQLFKCCSSILRCPGSIISTSVDYHTPGSAGIHTVLLITGVFSMNGEYLLSILYLLKNLPTCHFIVVLFISMYRNLMEDIDLLRIDSPSFFALGKL